MTKPWKWGEYRASTNGQRNLDSETACLVRDAISVLKWYRVVCRLSDRREAKRRSGEVFFNLRVFLRRRVRSVSQLEIHYRTDGNRLKDSPHYSLGSLGSLGNS